MDYTAVGQTTHLAARMEQLASAGTTLLTADTLRLAEGFVAVKPIGPAPVKGLEAPVEVYEMLGAGPLRSRLHAAAARGLTRFVGRRPSSSSFARRSATPPRDMASSSPSSGSPASASRGWCGRSRTPIGPMAGSPLQASSVSYGKATPYLPVIDLLKGYLPDRDQDDPRAVREKVTGSS